MKKALIIALAGVMIFAFTQCGGTKEFTETNRLYKNIEKSINEATTCDELNEAVFTLIFSALAGETYSEKDRMTEAEEAKLEEYLERISKIIDRKSYQLGCDDEGSGD